MRRNYWVVFLSSQTYKGGGKITCEILQTSSLPLPENPVCRIEPDVKWLKRLLDHWEMVNYSYKCQLTWMRGLHHMVHFVIKVQKLLLGTGKINKLDRFFFLPVENEERPLILSSYPFFCINLFCLWLFPLIPNPLLDS